VSGGHHAVKLLIDEDLSPKVAQDLRERRGADAVHLRDRGKLGLSDTQVLDYALAEERVVVTANVKDFQRLVEGTELHAGIVLVLDGNLLRHEQISLIDKVLDILTKELAEGRDMVNRVLQISAREDHQHELVVRP
jgi:predicted nuclease of predicted toxin-antitoxin system